MPTLPDTILRDIRNTLMHLKSQGFTGFDCSPEALQAFRTLTGPPKAAQARETKVPGGSDVSPGASKTAQTGHLRASGPAPNPATKAAPLKATQPESLAAIQADITDCHRCNLAEGRTRIVFGDGHPQARLVFVGEGPGHDEDLQGLPFVGRAGQLLTRIIEAMGLQRSDVYICNIVKCRPPGNRNPAPAEIEACSPFLRRQLAAIQPEFICALGTFAAQTLLDTATPISRLRGRFHTYQGIELIPTFHPAYLLRNPASKREVWEDMQQLMQAMGLPPRAVKS